MRKQFGMIYFILAIVLSGGIVSAVDGSGKKTKWLGERRMENSVAVISNPASPQYGQVKLNLREVAAIVCGENRQDLFKWIDKIVVAHDDSLYALEGDKCTVYHFDKNGVFINKFGKKGEGPGEFRRPSDLYCDGNQNIYVLDGTIISVFNYKGEHKKQMKLPKYVSELFDLPHGGFIVNETVYSEKSSDYVIERYDEQLNKEKELFRAFAKKNTQRQVGKKYITFHVDHAYQPQLVFEKTSNGHCIFGHTLEYALYVIGESGEVIKKIVKAEKPKKISEKEKEVIYNFYAPKNEKNWTKPVLKEALQYPAHRPFFNRILADDQGRIFVFRVNSVLDDPESAKIRADLFDGDGHFIQEVLMPFMPDFIKEGILYWIHEDDDSGDVSIKLYQVENWQQLKD